MTDWNESHFTRAREFLRLVAEAAGSTPPAAATDVPPPAIVRAPRPPAPPPVSIAAAPGAPTTPVTPSTAPQPAPGPSAASVFKKIPWKK